MTAYGELFYEIWAEIEAFFSKITDYLSELFSALNIDTSAGATTTTAADDQ